MPYAAECCADAGGAVSFGFRAAAETGKANPLIDGLVLLVVAGRACGVR